MRHRLFIPAATALLFALAACTQDELAGDNRLPEGEYPVFIRATGLSVEATPLAAPSTRAAVDGDWQGVTSVALKMGDAVKEYTKYRYSLIEKLYQYSEQVFVNRYTEYSEH